MTSHGKIHLKMWLKFCYWVVKSKEAILDAKCLYTLPIYNLGLLLRYYVTVTFILVTPRYRHKTRGSYHSILRWFSDQLRMLRIRGARERELCQDTKLTISGCLK